MDLVESRLEINKVVLEVSKIVSQMTGIQLGEKQAMMVEGRLKSRIRILALPGFNAYLEFLHQNQETESQALVSLMTTHHTFFFREFTHFEYLLNQGLNNLVDRARARGDKVIRIWSAACSRGQEVYSLTMFFKFHLSAVAPDVQFEVYGTDVDPESVSFAQNGVYPVDELKSSPAMYMQKHWIRGKGNVSGFYKAANSLRQHVRLEAANLLSPQEFLKGKSFDVIFCRNVFIYFNHEQIRSITNSFLNNLDKDGLLFLGVSETLGGLKVPITSVGPSVYSKLRPVDLSTRAAMHKAQPSTASSALVQEKRIFKILCIDDSPTIHALLRKILTKENDFEIAAKANNGLEALEILKAQKFDAITLDLHMPGMDGISFLESYKDRSAPILILSSVNRDEQSLGQKALSLGAFDYIEKPSLENLSQAGNEVRAKLKTCLLNKKSAPASRVTENKKIRVLIVDDSKTIRQLLRTILSQDSDFLVVGETERPSQVEKMIDELKPDLMTLDVHMPEMDGVTLLKRLPARCKIPTVLISSISKEEGPQVLEALELGAIDYIQKPQMSELGEIAPLIRERLKAAASTKSKKKYVSKKSRQQSSGQYDPNVLVAIGASTGGTEALRVLLESMPSQIPPILIVQHIPPLFSKAFADRLNHQSPFEVKEAQDGDEVKPNRVLIAPGGKQMAFRMSGGKWKVLITDDAPVNRHRPSVDYLFKSIVESGHKRVVSAILTGMGGDGAKQMLALKKAGARTIAQDQDSSIVFGMPRVAIELGGVEFVLSLDDIGGKIVQLARIAEKKAA